MAKDLKARGGKLIGDYGSFQVIEMDAAALTGSGTNRVELADEFNFIRLNAELLDTRAPHVKAQRKPLPAFKGKRLHLVHFAGPIKNEWREALEATGVRVVSYVPENAYLVYADGPALGRLQAWANASESVQWEGEYTREHKIHPAARAVRRQSGRGGGELFAIQLVADDEANAATAALIEQWQLAPVNREWELLGYRNIIVSLAAESADLIAAQPDVVSVQPYAEPKKRDERQNQIIAGNLTNGLPNGPGYLAWLASKGFTQEQFDASGFVVDISDSGIDNGTTEPGHFALYSLGDSSQTSRVIYNRLEGTPNQGSTLAGCDGHGALNAHIVGGYVDAIGFPHADAGGYRYGLGVCPFVRLGTSVIFDPDFFTRPNYVNLQARAYQNGARISNNSWGADVNGRYNSDAQTYDALVRDAQPNGSAVPAAGNQEMIIVFVAGNVGLPQSINSPGSAKNVITVGGSENVRSLNFANGGNRADGSDYCGETDAQADNANEIQNASSRGPCADGRMKPDLVAPGSHITGGVPQNSPPPSLLGTGSALSCFDATGVCALRDSGGVGNPNNFFPLGQQFYTVSSGTSHAAPAVAGACALLRQYFINQSLPPASAAMTKAWLMASARYLVGANAKDTLWSPNQGMGALNLGAAFEAPPRVLRDQVSGDKFTATGQTRTFHGTISDSTKSLRVTLAWTDAPGSTFGSAYKNNLNLTVTIGGNSYKGNVFKGQYSVTGGTFDLRNNVESVFLPPGFSGPFSITVSAANINSDGVPNEAPALDQDFALVALEVTSPVPAFSPETALFNGLFSEPGNVQLGSSGAITVSTTTAGSYSGAIQLRGQRFSFSGQLTVSGTATNSVARKGAPPLTLILQVTNNHSRVVGTLSDGNWSADLRAERVVFGKLNPTPLAGKYTIVFPGTMGDPQLPDGDGYGTLTINSAGQIKLKGSLADGTKISHSALLSGDGQWPLYVSLYSGQGELFGWLTVASGSDEDIAGAVTWIKNPVPASRLYPNGFSYEVAATGSFFNPLVNPPLVLTNGQLILTGGDLSGGITNSVGLADRKIINFSPNKLSLGIATSGLFKGSVVHPVEGVAFRFNGVVLQKQNIGAGYFPGTTQSGKVFLGDQ